MLDSSRRAGEKLMRFRRPEFQEKLARARKFQRKSAPATTSHGVWGSTLKSFLGLRSSRLTQAMASMVILLAVYFLTISQTFLVKEASLLAPGHREEEINEVLLGLGERRKFFIPKNHILILTRESLLEALQKDLPEVRSISAFRRIFPNQVEFKVEKRKPTYVFRNGDSYYLLDQDGVVFQKINRYDEATFPEPLVINRAGEEESVTVGEKLPIERVLTFISELRTQWSRQISQTSYLNFLIPSLKSPDLLVRTGLFGFSVYFDTGRSAALQLRNLALLLNQEIKPETFAGLSYIDIRLPTTAYYCYQDAPCALEKEK